MYSHEAVFSQIKFTRYPGIWLPLISKLSLTLMIDTDCS